MMICGLCEHESADNLAAFEHWINHHRQSQEPRLRTGMRVGFQVEDKVFTAIVASSTYDPATDEVVTTLENDHPDAIVRAQRVLEETQRIIDRLQDDPRPPWWRRLLNWLRVTR